MNVLLFREWIEVAADVVAGAVVAGFDDFEGLYFPSCLFFAFVFKKGTNRSVRSNNCAIFFFQLEGFWRLFQFVD